MMPVYEAVTNALYAIQERYPETWADDGRITIDVLRQKPDNSTDADGPQTVDGFVVTDNGIGLDDILFGHFQELDTEYRSSKKGRGIGRLSWIKVFNSAEILSVFERNGEKIAREFTFRLSNERPFDAYSEAPQYNTVGTGTKVKLHSFRDAYSTKAYVDPQDIRNSLLSHFIALFAQPKRLKIDLIDDGEVTNLSNLFFDSIVAPTSPVEVAIDERHAASILHVLLPKNLAPIGNSLIYCAADRSVITKPISEMIGLKALPHATLGPLIYIGLVSGPLFDDALNHERTGFDFGDIDFDIVNKALVNTAKQFLDPFLAEPRRRNREMLDKLLETNPLYASAIDDVEGYAAGMPLNWDETRLVQDVALKRHRATKALFRQVEKLEANSASMSDETFAAHVADLSAQLGDAEKSALAQYVVERRWVIELLKERRKIDLTTSRHEPENIVHEVFCPLGVTSDTIDYDDHNLWLIDDRLAYYSYITSDRPIKSFARDPAEVGAWIEERRSDLAAMGAFGEAGEPDLAIFKRPMLFRRANTMDPAVIVEFKSPSKTTYSGAPGDNPVIQIRKYIESLLEKSCYAYDGQRITDINKGTPFLCFLIAEPSHQLYELLRQHQIHKPTPDGDGRFAYLEDLNAYFEFIPYDQVLKNAALRNEAFFRKLKVERLMASSRRKPLEK
ncbi:MAG: hypothetical protein ACT6SK_04805 [Phenylobacterium sp.]